MHIKRLESSYQVCNQLTENGICGIDVEDSDTTCTITINRSTNIDKVIELRNLPRESFILTKTDIINTFYNSSSAGCFYLDRTSGDQVLVFILITRSFSIILLHYVDDNSISGVKGILRLGMCNVLCNFNLCKSNGSPISYDELVSAVQDNYYAIVMPVVLILGRVKQ